MSDKPKVKLRVSGSSAQLASKCAHWVNKEVEPEEQSELASEGTRLHALAEVLITGEVLASELSDPSDLAVARVVRELTDTPGFEVIALEQAYAFDVVTHEVRDIEAVEHRDYGHLAETEVPFTTDLIYKIGTQVYVRDWKFGPKGVSHYDSRGHAQLILAALAAAHVQKIPVDKIIGEFCALDGTIDASPITSPQVYDLTTRLTLALTRVNTDTMPGDHCTFCKYKPHCSEGVAELFAPITKAAGTRVELTDRIQSPDHAMKMLVAFRYISREVDRLKDVVREYAKHIPLVDKDGKVYEFREFKTNGYTIQAAKFSNNELEELVSQGKATRRESSGRWDFYKPRGVK